MRGNTLKTVLILAVLLVVAVLAITYLAKPRWTVERVQDTVVTTLRGETAAAQLVGGSADMMVNREITDQGRFSWVPDWLGAPALFGASARVQVVGSVHYGIDASELTVDRITIAPDGAIEIDLPPIRVIAIEPNLAQMVIRHHSGILRPGADLTLRDEALAEVQEALREQAEQHLQWSGKSAENVARSLVAMLTPAFEAAGMRNPTFRFRLADDIIFDTALTQDNDRVALPNP